MADALALGVSGETRESSSLSSPIKVSMREVKAGIRMFDQLRGS